MTEGDPTAQDAAARAASPHSIVAPTLTWTKERGTRRGPAPDLTQIVPAAVAIGDAEGIEAVSMRRVAAALRSGTASLYRSIDGREELLDLMVDAVFGDDPHPPSAALARGDGAADGGAPHARPPRAGPPRVRAHRRRLPDRGRDVSRRRGRHVHGVRARGDREGDGRGRDATPHRRDGAAMARPGRALRAADRPKRSLPAVGEGRPRGGRPRPRATIRVRACLRPRRHRRPTCRPAARLGTGATPRHPRAGSGEIGALPDAGPRHAYSSQAEAARAAARTRRPETRGRGVLCTQTARALARLGFELSLTFL